MAGVDAFTVLSPRRERRASPGALLIFAALLTGALFALAESRHLAMAAAIAAVVVLIALVPAIDFIFHHRDWLACALILVLMLTAMSFPGATPRTAFHYSALAILCIPLIPYVARSEMVRTGGFRLLTGYYLWAAITVIYSLSPLYSTARLGEACLVAVALTAIVSDISDEGEVRNQYVRFLIGAGIILAAVALSAIVLPHSVTWYDPRSMLTREKFNDRRAVSSILSAMPRFQGILDGPNTIGALMFITVAPALVCWRAASRRMRLLLLGVIAVAIVLAVMADSRSGFVALGIGCCLYAIWRWRWRGLFALLGTGLVGLALLIAKSHGGAWSEYVARGDVATATGRIPLWTYVVSQVAHRPLFGYGYEVAGQIYQNPLFPIWWGPWDMGPHSSLHDGYLDHAIGVGIPATLLWMFVVLRPWVFVMRQAEDPWDLKPVFFIIVIPTLIYNLTESLLGDFTSSVGLLFGLSWAIAERYRFTTLRHAEARKSEILAALPRGVAALDGVV
jgi:hypothetical protein